MNLKRNRARLSSLHAFVHRALPFVFPFAGGILAILIFALASEGGNCVEIKPAPLPDLGLFVAGICGLIAGRYLSHLKAPGEVPPNNSPKSMEVTHNALLGFFFVFTAIWFVEAMGTARVVVLGPRAEAITHYIRCALYLDSVITGGIISIIVIAAIWFVAGHWLLANHPERREPSP